MTAAAVEDANTAFYDGVEALSLDAMDALWADSEEVWCVHPGGELITGRGPVRRSWAAIFASMEYLQFIVTDITVRVHADVAVVTCTENMLTSSGPGPGLGAGKAVATNVFVRRDGAWRMLAHHASPLLRRL